MSRIGKNPVAIPAGVNVDLAGQTIKAKGKRGELSLVIPDEIAISRDGDEVAVKPRAPICATCSSASATATR
jgi:large subunit ribosomal protein L6